MARRLVITWAILTVFAVCSLIWIGYTDYSFSKSCENLDKRELHYDVDDGWFILINDSDKVIGVYKGIDAKCYVSFDASLDPGCKELRDLKLIDTHELYSYCFQHNIPQSTPVLVIK